MAVSYWFIELILAAISIKNALPKKPLVIHHRSTIKACLQ